MGKIHLTFSISLFLLIALLHSCGSGPAMIELAGDNTAINIEAGGIDVPVDQAITITFGAPMSVSSVTPDTYFITQSGTINSAISTQVASTKVSEVDPAICDPANAVPATITPVSSGDCVTAFTIASDSDFEHGTNYTLCATSGIETCNPNVDGFFGGIMQGFTTVADTANTQCVETESCSGECGGMGYSNNDGTSCYSDSDCSTECPGDTTRPTVTITSNEATLTAQSPFTITITFSEEVAGFEVGDMTVTNAAASSLTATTENKVYTASVTPPSGDPITITISIADGVVTDANGNENEVSNTFSIRYDTSFLSVSIDSSVTDPTNDSPFEVTIEFSEEVSGFVVGDISVTNGAAGNFNSDSNPIFTSDITPTADGIVTIEVNAGVATDALTGEKSNTAAPPFSTTYDGTAPTVDNTSPADADVAVAVDTSVDVTFDEVMAPATITTNTSDTVCSGSLQVSDDDFATCVQMTSGDPTSGDNETFTITPDPGLDYSTAYKIKVTTAVTDVAGNALAAEYETGTGFTTSAAPKIIFVTNTRYNGDLGGKTGADEKCMNDYYYPGSGTYKAMITTRFDCNYPPHSSLRVACCTANCTDPSENYDWALAPNTPYTRADGTPLFTTNSGSIFNFNDGDFTNPIHTSTYTMWTGLDSDWTTPDSYQCNKWSTTSSSVYAETGYSSYTNYISVARTDLPCNYTTRRLYCVEQ